MKLLDVNMKAINRGVVLETNYSIKAFKLFGKYYTTNMRRKRLYSFDDTSWKPTKHGFLWKCLTVYKGKAKRLY